MHIPDLDLLDIVKTPLRSPVRWVREQALILLASTERGIGANLPTEIGYDLANGVLLSRFGAYVHAISTSEQRGAIWSLFLGTVCALLGLLCLLGEAAGLYWGVLTLAESQMVPEWLLKSGVVEIGSSRAALGVFVAILVTVGVWTFLKRPEQLWVAIPGSALGTLGIVAWLSALWSGPPASGPGVFLGGFMGIALSALTAPAWFGVLAAMFQFPLLMVYLIGTTRMRARAHGWRGFASSLKNTLGLHSGAAYGLIFIFLIPGLSIWAFGLEAFASAICALAAPVYAAMAWSLRREILDIPGLAVQGIFDFIRRFVADAAYRKRLAQESKALALMAAGIVLFVATFALLKHFNFYVGRLLFYVLVVCLFASSLWVVYQLVIWLLYVARRRPFPRGSFTVDEWKSLLAHSKPARQQNILSRTHHESLDLTPAEFLDVVREMQGKITAEPAQSTYWARRYELEEVLRQERLVERMCAIAATRQGVRGPLRRDRTTMSKRFYDQVRTVTGQRAQGAIGIRNNSAIAT